MPLASWITISHRLGIAAAAALVFSVLALQDIWHGETDLRLEFWVVRASTLVIALFIGTALRTLAMVRRTEQSGAARI